MFFNKDICYPPHLLQCCNTVGWLSRMAFGSAKPLPHSVIPEGCLPQ